VSIASFIAKAGRLMAKLIVWEILTAIGVVALIYAMGAPSPIPQIVGGGLLAWIAGALIWRFCIVVKDPVKAVERKSNG
jgi:threonine/homoserine/homoserine lactone efflux protein